MLKWIYESAMITYVFFEIRATLDSKFLSTIISYTDPSNGDSYEGFSNNSAYQRGEH